MQNFVITFTELKQDHKVIWTGVSAKGALETFWYSFYPQDRKRVSNVRIYRLVEVPCDTAMPEGEIR